MKNHVILNFSLLILFLGGNSMAQKITTNTLELNDALKKEFFQAAALAADWMLNNQITGGYDANKGRFLYSISIKDSKPLGYSGNWLGGASIMAMLMMYHRTADNKYLDAAIKAGGYLKTLQILDQRKPEWYGAFREDTPQSNWCHPRDGLTAAWGLLWLYEETKEKEYLARVELFNKWFVEQAMSKGWPSWSYYYYDKKPDYLQGSFHGGDGAYFYDYFRVTGDSTYQNSGMKFIVDYALEKFLGPDGKVRVIFDADKGKYIEDGITFDGMQKMHRHNDDFMSISILDAYVLYKDAKYLERAEAYAKWLISEQREDGGFGNPDVPPAAATGPNFLIDLYSITKNPEYLKAALKGAGFLLSRQHLNPKDKTTYGGFFGYDDNWNSDHREIINLRTTCYAVIALLKLEGKEKGPYYSPFDRSGNYMLQKNNHQK